MVKNQKQKSGSIWKMNENGMIIYADVAGKSIISLEYLDSQYHSWDALQLLFIK